VKISRILATKGDFVATVPASSKVTSLLATLAQHRIGAVVVVDESEAICGIASERDVVRALNRIGVCALDATVSALMTDVVVVCSPDSTIEEIAIAMTNARVRHVPVLHEDGELVGIVSIGDVVKARIDQLEHDRQTLMEYITT